MSVITALMIFLISVSIIIVSAVIYRINSAMVMIGVTIFFGLLSGMPINEILNVIRSGFGSTAGYIGIVILEGVVMGILLEKTGALYAIASAIVKRTGNGRAAVSVNLMGYALSIPVSCDSGFVVLSPLARAIAASSGRSMASVLVALASGLYVSHSLVFPTPGPASAAGILNASVWKVFFLGLAVSVPGLIAGCLWSVKFAGSFDTETAYNETCDVSARPYNDEPSLIKSVAPFAVTILLMVLRGVAVIPSHPFGNGLFAKYIVFAGDPVFALFAGILCSFILVKKGYYKEAAGGWIAEGVKHAALLLFLLLRAVHSVRLLKHPP